MGKKMKREEQINIIIDFMLDKENVLVRVSESKEGSDFQHIFLDCEAEGKPNTETGIISLKAHQRTLFAMIAVAMIDNPKKHVFSGMAGKWDKKRLEKGITFGFGGWAFENLYPKGKNYEYRLHAWVR